MTSVDDRVDSARDTQATDSSQNPIIDEVAGRLVDVYAQLLPEQIFRVVRSEYARFAGSRIRDFVPLFVERNARAKLSKLAD